MALSDSRRKANDKYIADHYTRIALSMPNDEADALRAFCSDHGLTVAGFIRGLIRDAIAADSGQAYPVGDLAGADLGQVTSPNTRKE